MGTNTLMDGIQFALVVYTAWMVTWIYWRS